MTFKFDHEKNHLFLDMDGVLADFDKSAMRLFHKEKPDWPGVKPKEYEQDFGTPEFWRTLHTEPNFFIDLELMGDARDLYDAVKHLNPTILTGIPLNMDAFENQKVQWAAKYFGPDQKVICCRASRKWEWVIHRGDVLVDDRPKHQKQWEKKGGGYWVTHTSAESSLNHLRAIGVI